MTPSVDSAPRSDGVRDPLPEHGKRGLLCPRWRAVRAAALLAGCSPALLAGCATPDGAPEPVDAVDASVRTASIPVEVPLNPYFRELRTVDVVSGTDTLSFLLDTGGGHTLVTPEAARRLGCTPYGRSVGHRMSGETAEFQWCDGVPLEIGGVSLSGARTAVFDLAAVLPAELPDLDGLLALDSFTGGAVTIDLAGSRIVLETGASADARRGGMVPLRARAATGDDGTSLTVFLAAHAEPGLAWLLVDSGNLVGTILSPQAARRLAPARAGEDVPRSGESLRLHLVGLSPRPEPVLIRDVLYDGVLGADFFLEHVVMFDLRGREPSVAVEPRAGPSS